MLCPGPGPQGWERPMRAEISALSALAICEGPDTPSLILEDFLQMRRRIYRILFSSFIQQSFLLLFIDHLWVASHYTGCWSFNKNTHGILTDLPQAPSPSSSLLRSPQPLASLITKCHIAFNNNLFDMVSHGLHNWIINYLRSQSTSLIPPCLLNNHSCNCGGLPYPSTQ